MHVPTSGIVALTSSGVAGLCALFGQVAPAGQEVAAQVTANGIGSGAVALGVISLLTLIVNSYFADRRAAREVDAARLRAENDRLTGRVRELESLVTVNAVEAASAGGKVRANRKALRRGGLIPDPPPTDANPGAHPSWILIVEDDPGIVRAMTDNFEDLGFETKAVSLADEAMAVLDGPDRPAWVILDLKLADGEGVRVLEKVRREHLPSKVLVASGATDPERIAAARALHPDGWVNKPFTIEQLMRFISPGSGDDLPAFKPTD